MKIIKEGSLQIESEARRLNTTFLIFQKVGFTMMILVLIAASLGLFGKGFFSSITKTSGNLTIEYEKFIRQQASTVYQIVINQTPNTKNNVTKFWIDQSFYKNLSIKSISPSPIKEEIVDGKVIYVFSSLDTNKIYITLVIEPEEFGFISSEIGLSNQDKIQFTQLIYP